MNALSTLALILLLDPPEPTPEPGSSAGLTAEVWDVMSYDELIVQLERGIEIGDRRPEEAISILEPALEALPRFAAELVEDPPRLELRAEAHVSLARAYLTIHEDDEARAAMDEGIRSAPFGQQLPAARYGPKVEKLWARRAAALEMQERDSVEVECWVACRVLLNEREVEGEAPSGEGEPARVVLEGLSEGTYRLWVEALDGSLEPIDEDFEAREPGARPLVFRLGTAPAPVLEEPPAPEPVIDEGALELRPPPPATPMLPRAAEISAIVAGVGLVASGVALFVINDRCANPKVEGAVPADGSAVCPSLWNTGVAGLALIGAGAGVTVLGSVFLGIDEVRRANQKNYARVRVGWGFRF